MGKRSRAALVLLCLGLVTPTVVPAQAATPAARTFDYSRIPGLSSKVYPSTIRETVRMPMADGVEVYIEITRPKTTARVPVIAEISPYHGTIYERDGSRMLPTVGGLEKYFVPRGYAVLMMDVRGTGRSQGCLNLMGPKDQADAKEVIEWAAARPWSNGRVGVLGHSYPGGTSVMSLGERPKGLATAVISAGLGSMYEHQFQAGVPFNLQWAGPYSGYFPLTLERHLPFGLPQGSGNGGDNLGNDMQYVGCGVTSWPTPDGDSQLSGKYSPWHRVRDFRSAAAKNPVPVFVIHGVNDAAARITALDWFFRRSGTSDKLWVGQWGHGSGCCPNTRGWQWVRALHAWFDAQLQQRDVSTGPPVEVFVSDATEQEAIDGKQTAVYAPPKFSGRDRLLAFYPDARSGAMSTIKPRSPRSASFTGDPFGYGGREFTDGVEFRTRPFPGDMLMVGVPTLDLATSLSVPRVHLIASVYDESSNGSRRRLTQFAINPELREGLSKIAPVVPMQKYVLRPPGFTMAHHLRKGHRLVLRVTTSDPDKVPFFAVDPQVTVFTGNGGTVLRVPVVDDPFLYADTVSLKTPK